MEVCCWWWLFVCFNLDNHRHMQLYSFKKSVFLSALSSDYVFKNSTNQNITQSLWLQCCVYFSIFMSECLNSFKITFRLLNNLNHLQILRNSHNKIEKQILNACKLPENPIKCKLQEENAPFFFFFQACTVICFLFQRKKALINVSMSFEKGCCPKTIQQCFLGSTSRVGATLLLLILAKKSELFQSANGRTSKCYNAVFPKMMRGFFH